MLSDPQSITINSVATSFPRIELGNLSSIYRTADGGYTFKISHQETGKRVRHLIRLEQKKVAADPLTAVNSYQTGSVHMVIDEPVTGFSDTELKYLIAALMAWFTSGNQDKILAAES